MDIVSFLSFPLPSDIVVFMNFPVLFRQDMISDFSSFCLTLYYGSFLSSKTSHYDCMFMTTLYLHSTFSPQTLCCSWHLPFFLRHLVSHNIPLYGYNIVPDFLLSFSDIVFKRESESVFFWLLNEELSFRRDDSGLFMLTLKKSSPLFGTISGICGNFDGKADSMYYIQAMHNIWALENFLKGIEKVLRQVCVGEGG